jgi:hypothetical protein
VYEVEILATESIHPFLSPAVGGDDTRQDSCDTSRFSQCEGARALTDCLRRSSAGECDCLAAAWSCYRGPQEACPGRDLIRTFAQDRHCEFTRHEPRDGAAAASRTVETLVLTSSQLLGARPQRAPRDPSKQGLM